MKSYSAFGITVGMAVFGLMLGSLSSFAAESSGSCAQVKAVTGSDGRVPKVVEILWRESRMSAA